MIDNFNPFLAKKDVAQHISWKHLKDKVEYDLEFIQPSKGFISSYRHQGIYLVVAVQARADQETNVLPLRKDSMLVLDVPVKTFDRAWQSVDHHTRTNIENSNNVRLKILKKTYKSIFIKSIEKLKPTPEQLEFADDVYSNPELYANECAERTKVKDEEVY